MSFFCISHTISRNDLHPSAAPRLETFKVSLIYLPNCPIFSTILKSASNVASFIGTTKLLPQTLQFIMQRHVLKWRRVTQVGIYDFPQTFIVISKCSKFSLF